MSSCSRAVHRHPSPSITVHRHTVHHRQVAIMPSLSVHHHCNRSPSPSRLCCPSPYIAIKELSRHPSPSKSCCAVHCRCAVPSITVKEPSMLAVNLSTAFKSPSLRPLLSVAVESPPCLSLSPSIAVHHHCDRSRSPSSLRLRCPSLYCRLHRCQGALTVKRLLSTVHHRPVAIVVALSIAVSHPAGCCVSSRHADASCPPVQDFPHGMFNLFLMHNTIL